MGSPTKKVMERRAIRKAKSAKKRKNHLKNHGSTPKQLVLNQPNAQERALHTPAQ